MSTTGVAGLTLGGGSGWLERKFGLACDNLISVELVTADGRLLIADETKNTELFWALHGGGGNFGVATSLTFRLEDVPTCTLALLMWPARAGPAVVRAYRDLIEAGVSEDLGGGVIYLTGPPEPFVPEHLQGQLIVAPERCTPGPRRKRGMRSRRCSRSIRSVSWSRRCRTPI